MSLCLPSWRASSHLESAIYDVDNESLLPTVYDSYKEAAEDAADLTDSGSVVQIIKIEV